ncbi:MAG: carcinine hydrolase/isopenicillin-N N-acyltransferase family protein [Acidimicrobiales bacterium]
MCDTLVSLTDGGVLFAKNSDRDPNESQVLRWHPAADHDAGTDVACTWLTVPQVAHTHAVVVSQPWWMWGAEMGANEHGVVIGNEAVFTKALKGDTALLGMDLLRLALERAATAAEAVQVMVELLERHGQGGSCSHEHPDFTYHNSFLVADPNGAIVLETADRAWATEDVQGPGRSISNGLTIAAFAAAHTDRLRGLVAACAVRQGRTQTSAEGATEPADLFAALRDHGDDPSPAWSRMNGAFKAPCAHAGGRATSTQTTSSWVADLRSAPLHWVTATSAPCTSIFKPVRVDVPCDLGPDPTNHADQRSVWWRHERLHRLALRDIAASTARFTGARRRVESDWLADPPVTTDAFAHADDLERRWLADLCGADLPDRRPRWLRSLWSKLDEAAGFDATAGLDVPAELDKVTVDERVSA